MTVTIFESRIRDVCMQSSYITKFTKQNNIINFKFNDWSISVGNWSIKFYLRDWIQQSFNFTYITEVHLVEINNIEVMILRANKYVYRIYSDGNQEYFWKGGIDE